MFYLGIDKDEFSFEISEFLREYGEFNCPMLEATFNFLDTHQ